jgi:hypothetical protein
MALAVSVAATSAPGLAYADSAPLPLELDWDAPEGCPNAAFVMHRVEQILRAPPTVVGGGSVKGSIRKTGGTHFELTLTIHTGEVEDVRAIQATSCSALAEAGAVAISLSIDPAKEVPSPQAPTPARPPIAAVAPRSTPARAPMPTERHAPAPAKPRVALALGTAIESGTLPQVGAGLCASSALDLGGLRVGALGAFSFRQHPVFDTATSAGASFDTFNVGFFGSYIVAFGRLAFGPAANIELTYMRVEGSRVRSPRASSTVWPTGVLGGRAELDIFPHLRAFGRVDALVPLDAPTVILGGQGARQHLYEPEPVALRFSFGAEIVLP